MEGMSLLLPAPAVCDDVFGGLVATDRTMGIGSLIMQATAGGRFSFEKNDGFMFLEPKRMMEISDIGGY